jgi:hypothetical protein
MGHSLEVHKKNYRYPLEVIQRGKIAPHLMKLGGVDMSIKDKGQTENIHQINKSMKSVHEKDDPDYNVADYNDDSDDNNLEDQHRIKKPKKSSKSHTKKKHTKWTEQEKSLVIETFKDFMRIGRNPGTALCQKLIADHPLLSNRTWAQVNTLIDNFNKGKTALPLCYQYLRFGDDSD